MSLNNYRKKRDFTRTPEPSGKKGSSAQQLGFVIQKHQASHLHYDLRLENEGVLKSWAVPKGPSLHPDDKRLAMQVEDHPLDYRDFEGIIPEGNYGAGKVIVWDQGIYYADKNLSRHENERKINKELQSGHLKIFLEGEKLRGGFSLIKFNRETEKNQWFLIKSKDEFADKEIIDERSVKTGKTLDELDNYYRVVIDKKELTNIDLSGSKPSPMPKHLAPMLATLTDKPFDHDDWLFEIKWDGYRALARIEKNNVDVYSRSFKSFNRSYPVLVEALKSYPYDAIFDGEIIVPDKEGVSQFQLLQNYQRSGKGELMFYLFDILFFNGNDLRDLPLVKRKSILCRVMPGSPLVQFSDDLPGKGTAFFDEAERIGLEGIMAKKKNSKYHAGKRSPEWLKIKVEQRQETVIGGITAPQGSRTGFGALVLGVYDGQDLRYVGHTGGGFSESLLKEIREKVSPYITDKCPFKKEPRTNTKVTWLRPELVCEVKFREWTNDGHMRQPVFIGMREDKKPTEVIREKKKQTSQFVEKDSVSSSIKVKNNHHNDSNKNNTQANARISLSNIDKIYWPEEGYTKGDVIEYYQFIAPYILPFLKDRPQSMNRHPDGINGEHFFHKDVDSMPPDWVRTQQLMSGSHGKINYIICDNRDVLAYLNNLGCIEINVWSSRVQSPQNPDYMVFDLDPVDTPFINLIRTAHTVKELLDDLGMPGFCKTSGGRGIHIYVPIGDHYTFEQIKDFSYLLSMFIHEKEPSITSLERSPSKRKGLVYLDYLQNHYAATMAAPYSIRPRPGATVSTPLDWDEVNEGLDPGKFNIKTMAERIKAKGDVWKGFFDQQTSIEEVLAKI
jgi:bifunctional non-homologous end joining protein LigD